MSNAQPSREERRRRLGFLLLCCSLTAVPFLLVRFPPITDLPQHAAQIRLFGEALGDHQDLYKIQWLTPYSLSYLAVGAAWLAAGPREAGRFGFLIMAILWVLAVHLLAWKRGRPISHAVLASALVFNHALYYGFLSFLGGWPAFAVWITCERERRDRVDWRGAGAILGLGLLLYFTHVLWFAVACLWLALAGFLARLPLRTQLLRLACTAPVWLLAAWWFPTLARRGFDSPVWWPESLLERIGLEGLRHAVLGGLRGAAEPAFLVALAGWALLALWQHRGELRLRLDAELLWAAGLLFLLGMSLPDEYKNTIRFAQRWMPVAAVLMVLALPAPKVGSALRRVCATGALLLFCAVTTVYWVAFERVEMAGIAAALEVLPERPRLIGLSYRQQSPIIYGYPFLQDFAYAQVWHGGELNFSFADFAPSLVVYRRPRHPPWTHALEWLPKTVRRSDFRYFDFALIQGDAAAQDLVTQSAGLKPVTTEGLWRLYRTPAGSGAGGPAAPESSISGPTPGSRRPASQ